METIFTLIQQTCIMFLLSGIGFLFYRSNKISSEGSRSIGNILIYASLPCVIINGFLVERTTERIVALGLSALLAFIILLLCVLVSHILFKNDPIAAFGAAFSNPGFFGVPLITALLTNDSVFYIAAFIGFLNLMQWTYGVSIMTGKKGKITFSKLIKAPFFLAIIIGIVLFLTQLQLPVILTKTISNVAALNTPLAMFAVGIYLAQTDIKKMFQKIQLYKISFVRLLLIPLLSMIVLIFVPAQFNDMKIALLIATACPVGSNIAVYAHLHNKDYPYAVETVVISTLLSIVTIPLIIFIFNL